MKHCFSFYLTGIYHYSPYDAAGIAVGTAKEFVEKYPDKINVIKRALFDDFTFNVYNELIAHVN